MKPGSAAPPPITNTPNAEGEKKRGDKRNTSRKTRMWHLLFWLAVIGALGTLSRYWLDGLVLRLLRQLDADPFAGHGSLLVCFPPFFRGRF